MTKIVYNASYGWFGLSDKAVQRYSDLAGLGLVQRSFSGLEQSLHWETPEGDFWSEHDLKRTDPFLVQVVEEMGKEAADFTTLLIEEVPSGTLYRIEEYDGMETVMTQDDYKWEVA